jgi:hypothetical protein
LALVNRLLLLQYTSTGDNTNNINALETTQQEMHHAIKQKKKQHKMLLTNKVTWTYI